MSAGAERRRACAARPFRAAWHGIPAALVVAAGTCAAQSPAAGPPAAYPARLIRVVTGSTAGGAADVTTRQITPRLAEALKVQIIVDNRPGVAGMIANEYVSKAAPDG